MAATSYSSSADAEPAGHEGDDDDDDGTSPLLDLLQQFPALCVETELPYDLSAAAGTSAAAAAAEADEATGAGAYTRPLFSST